MIRTRSSECYFSYIAPACSDTLVHDCTTISNYMTVHREYCFREFIEIILWAQLHHAEGSNNLSDSDARHWSRKLKKPEIVYYILLIYSEVYYNISAIVRKVSNGYYVVKYTCGANYVTQVLRYKMMYAMHRAVFRNWNTLCL